VYKRKNIFQVKNILVMLKTVLSIIEKASIRSSMID